MRILFVTLNRSPAYGGLERWMIDAAAGLERRGHTCLIVGRPGAPFAKAAARARVRVRLDHEGAWIVRVARFVAAMRAERPDVVIVKGKKAARMAALGRTLGVPAKVALLFGLTHELDPARWVDRHTWGRVDAGIVLADEAGRWYADRGFGPMGKLHTLWKGVDLEHFTVPVDRVAATRAALGLAPDVPAIGTVCRLAWQKGLSDLMAAVPAILAHTPRARIFIAGGGRDEPLVREEAARFGDAVRLLGQRDDVPGLMAAMDVFVQPSRREVMVQTTLEAMASGRAVVSTRTCGAAEAIEDGVSGVLVPVGDAAAMSGAVCELLDDPARRAELGRAARARVERHFAMGAMLDRCEAIVERMAAGEAADQGHSPLAREM